MRINENALYLSNSLKKFFNPLSPINHVQILLTDLHIFP